MNTARPQGLAERRIAPRQRSLLGAQIIFNRARCAIGGQILNFSETGALVRPADVLQCPEQFTLKPRFEAPRDCVVMWRKGGSVGVRYL
ncbi:MAG: PilZ domain-containing protein [Alphaproteobacteria bacterium]|nr:PilZ domain-containing protein [Alphaproteobacteria bacterium]